MENVDVLEPIFCGPTETSTFLIKFLYTQHNSAQGTVEWVDQEKVVSFRSFMELGYLLGEALQKRNDAEKFRTWERAKKSKF